jgi:hypothetical protein
MQPGDADTSQGLLIPVFSDGRAAADQMCYVKGRQPPADFRLSGQPRFTLRSRQSIATPHGCFLHSDKIAAKKA